MTRNQKFAVVLGLLVSAFFLWQAFSGLNPQEILSELQTVNPLWLIAAVGMFFVSMLIIALRWGYLLRALVEVPLGYLNQLVAIGYMGNNVYPFRSGEILRIVLLQRSHQVPFARLVTSVLVERVFDGLVMLSFVLLPLLFVENISPEIRDVAGFAAPIFITATVIFFGLAMFPQALRTLAERVAAILPAKLREIVIKLADDVIAGLGGLRNPKDLISTIIASYLTWLVQVVVYWMVAVSFNLQVDILIMVVVVGVVNLVGLIPASPGQIGVFEFFASRVLMGVGIDESRALAYALLVHIVIWLPATVYGFFCLAWRGLNLSSVVHAHTLQEDIAAEDGHA